MWRERAVARTEQVSGVLLAQVGDVAAGFLDFNTAQVQSFGEVVAEPAVGFCQVFWCARVGQWDADRATDHATGFEEHGAAACAARDDFDAVSLAALDVDDLRDASVEGQTEHD